jgi:predicted PurR-regulated permease PerM
MRFLWTLFWALLLSHMMNYVVANMQGISYDFQMATLVAVIFSLAIFLIGAMLTDNTASTEKR